MKGFFATVNRITRVKQGNTPIKGLQEEGDICYLQEDIDSCLFKYYSELLEDKMIEQILPLDDHLMISHPVE